MKILCTAFPPFVQVAVNKLQQPVNSLTGNLSWSNSELLQHDFPESCSTSSLTTIAFGSTSVPPATLNPRPEPSFLVKTMKQTSSLFYWEETEGKSIFPVPRVTNEDWHKPPSAAVYPHETQWFLRSFHRVWTRVAMTPLCCAPGWCLDGFSRVQPVATEPREGRHGWDTLEAS